MNRKTRQDIIDMIDSRFESICSRYTEALKGELDMAIDLAGLTDAIGLDQQRYYKERLNKIIDRNHQQWAEPHGRVA